MTLTTHLLSLVFAVLAGVSSVQAAPVDLTQNITPLSSEQIAAFTPYTYFASAAYCQPNTTISWSCGESCDGNLGFIPYASGGDGSSVQFWYVGYSPLLESVIVGHQGTDPSQIEAIATDLDVARERLNSTLFPGVPSAVRVHSGFAGEQAKTATDVLSAVKTALLVNSASKVAVVGHSLGAAIALLDSVYLPLHLPVGVTVSTFGYGMPRVGNQAFADYVDSHLNLTHINNMKDLVPIVPSIFLGYHHPSGEVHITEAGPWVSCPGQDNPSTMCSVGDVPNIFAGNVSNHHGPYNGINMGEGC
ncbi:hypothetical protein AX15_000821 [Amanita polypyramis BW_CC]|nr:hypothetical protein AX15_000821 [Amanita polypyramis BW_CC]